MKISRLAIAGAATALVAGAVITPSAAFASSSVSWSQPTICPGETVTLTVNGISDNSSNPITDPDEAMRINGNIGYTSTGPYTYGFFENVFTGQTNMLVEVVRGEIGQPEPTVLASDDLQILTVCAAPEPEAEALPDTGASAGTMTALALGAAALGLGGAVLARRARRVASSK
jgi:LPXTG-motif cell wall-anchored protein